MIGLTIVSIYYIKQNDLKIQIRIKLKLEYIRIVLKFFE